MTTRTKTTRAGIAALAAGAGLVLAFAAPLAANAHVRVVPDQASPGSYATLTFRVPTESDTASTVKLEVDLPTDTPFTSVSYEPVVGWSTKVVTTTLPKPVKTDKATITEAPTKVIWTADPGSGIAPGQFRQFVISAGIVPDTGSVLLPAHQTYSDGTVVDWDQKTPSSGDEPEHPAPTLYIKDAPPSAAEQAAGPTVTSAPNDASRPGVTTENTADSGDPLGVWLGLGSIVLAALAAVLAVVALRRPNAKSQSPANPPVDGDESSVSSQSTRPTTEEK